MTARVSIPPLPMASTKLPAASAITRNSAASVREINLRLADIIANMHNTPQSMQDALTAIDELARHVEALKGEIDTAASSAQEGISLYDQIRTL